MRHVINNRITRPLHDRKRAHIHDQILVSKRSARSVRMIFLCFPCSPLFSATFPISSRRQKLPLFYIDEFRPRFARQRSGDPFAAPGMTAESCRSMCAELFVRRLDACGRIVYVSKNRQFEFGLDLARNRKPSSALAAERLHRRPIRLIVRSLINVTALRHRPRSSQSSPAIIARAFRFQSAWPAIRNSGFPPPRRNAPSAISRVVFIRDGKGLQAT